jgi:hypothetical protein
MGSHDTPGKRFRGNVFVFDTERQLLVLLISSEIQYCQIAYSGR